MEQQRVDAGDGTDKLDVPGLELAARVVGRAIPNAMEGDSLGRSLFAVESTLLGDGGERRPRKAAGLEVNG